MNRYGLLFAIGHSERLGDIFVRKRHFYLDLGHSFGKLQSNK